MAKFLSFDVEISGTFNMDEVPELLTENDMELAAATGLALVKQRIQDGMRADGKLIKKYSTKAIYIPLAGIGTGTPRIKPKGGRKSRGGKFLSPKVKGKGSGKANKARERVPPKSMFFPEGVGYKGFREKAGRDHEKTNLTASGNLTGKRFRVLSKTAQRAIVGWPAGSKQAIVAAGLDARDDGMVFSWSNDEQTAVIESLLGSLATNLSAAGVPLTVKDVRMIEATQQRNAGAPTDGTDEG